MEARWCGSQQGQAQSQTPGFQRGPGSWVTLGHSVNPSTRLLLLHQMPSSLLGSPYGWLQAVKHWKHQ